MNKKIIASILTAVGAFAAAIGSTFALFTSDDKTDIAITSGNINISAKMEDLSLYSADYEYVPEVNGDPEECLVPGGNELGLYSGNYYYKKGARFSNGGTGEIVNGDLKLNLMTPGDKAVSKIVIYKGDTNVDFKYRIVCELVEQDNESLRFFSNLELTALGETRSHVRKFATNWALWDNAENSVSSLVKVAMPITFEDEFQDSNCTIRFNVEAVQANAYTADDIDNLFIQFDDKKVEAGSTTSGLKDLDLEAWKDETLVESEEATVKVHVPAGSGDVKALVETAPNVFEKQDLQLNDTLTLKVEAKEYEGTYTIEENDEVLNYEISLFNQDNHKIITIEDGEPLDVYINIGSLSNIKEVLHSGEELVPNEDDNFIVGEYEYDEETGIVHILTNTFSPFSVIYERSFACSVNDVPYLYMEEAFDALKNEKKATVVLNKEVFVYGNDGFTIGNGQDITIDLNGWTLNGVAQEARASQLFFVNGGKLTVKDTSKKANGVLTNSGLSVEEAGNWWSNPKNNYANNVILVKNGTFILESGNIVKGLPANIAYAIDIHSNSYVELKGGNVIEHIEQYASSAIRVANGYANNGPVKLVIDGATIKGGDYVLWAQYLSNTNNLEIEMKSGLIDGGVWEQGGSIKTTWNFSGGKITKGLELYGSKVNISGDFELGGDFWSQYYDWGDNVYSLDNVISISGGTFNGNFEVKNYGDNDVLNITGGKFAYHMVESGIASGGYYDAVNNKFYVKDGSFTVEGELDDKQLLSFANYYNCDSYQVADEPFKVMNGYLTYFYNSKLDLKNTKSYDYPGSGFTFTTLDVNNCYYFYAPEHPSYEDSSIEIEDGYKAIEQDGYLVIVAE